MKNGKKIKLDLSKVYKTNYGTVDNKNFKSTYLTVSCWAEPNKEEESWERVIKSLRRDIKSQLYNTVDIDIFKEEKSIIDLDIRSSGIRTGKRSYLNCEMTLFVKSNIEFKSEKINYSVTGILNGLIENVFETNKYFRFHKTKS
jgi:hypothetical protein